MDCYYHSFQSEKSTVLNFVNGIYYNAASIPAEYNSDFINSLAQRALSVEKNIELKIGNLKI